MTPALIGILGVGVALAAVIFTGLAGVNRRVEDLRRDLTTRMDGIDMRLRALETGFFELRERLAGLEGRFEGLEKRFDSLEKRFDSLERRFDSLENQVGFLRDYIMGRSRRPEEVAEED